MRRIGIVGGGLAGLSAALGAAHGGAEAAVFHRSETLGGLAAPLGEDWLFDRVPLAWRRKGRLDRLLRGMKVPMPSRPLPTDQMAVVREDARRSLPSTSRWVRRASGPGSSAWVEMIRAARAGEVSDMSEEATDMATLLSLLWDLRARPDAEAILGLAWRGRVEMPLDGWTGASGRLVAACMRTDVSFHTGEAVLGVRRDGKDRVTGIRREGRVLPVDAGIRAHRPDGRVLSARHLALGGRMMRPHAVLWDVDRKVLAVDLAGLIPERVPEEHRGSSTLLHCIALEDRRPGEERIEAFLDAQCPGWRGSILEEHSLRLRLPGASEEEEGLVPVTVENAFEMGLRLAQD